MTVTDPRRPADSAPRVRDEPDAGTPRPHRRRVLVAVLVVLLAAAGVRAGLATVQERRLDREVDLVRVPSLAQGSSSYDPGRGTGTYRTALRLQNRGPRDVRVVAARAGALRSTGELRLAADGGTGVLRLAQTRPCPRDGSRPEQAAGADDLVLRVATPGGTREVRLRAGEGLAGSARSGAQQACGYPELPDAVVVTARAARTASRTLGEPLTARVHVAQRSLRRLQLLSVTFARGLDVVALRPTGSRRPLVLPARLPVPTLGAVADLSFDVSLSVDCGAVAATGGVLFGDVDLLVEDVDDGDLGQVTGRVDGARLLRRAVAERCAR